MEKYKTECPICGSGSLIEHFDNAKVEREFHPRYTTEEVIVRLGSVYYVVCENCHYVFPFPPDKEATPENFRILAIEEGWLKKIPEPQGPPPYYLVEFQLEAPDDKMWEVTPLYTPPLGPINEVITKSVCGITAVDTVVVEAISRDHALIQGARLILQDREAKGLPTLLP